jgi:hypothetical protein
MMMALLSPIARKHSKRIGGREKGRVVDRGRVSVRFVLGWDGAWEEIGCGLAGRRTWRQIVGAFDRLEMRASPA